VTKETIAGRNESSKTGWEKAQRELLAIAHRDYERIAKAPHTRSNPVLARYAHAGLQQCRLLALRQRKAAPIVRTAARAPRRARPATTRPAKPGNDPPAEPPQPPRTGQQVGALVTQRNSGLPPRAYFKVIRDRQVPHTRVGRLVVVRLADLERAIGLISPAAPDEEPWSPAAMLKLIRGGK
jgi:hypothetical protein